MEHFKTAIYAFERRTMADKSSIALLVLVYLESIFLGRMERLNYLRLLIVNLNLNLFGLILNNR